MFCRFCGKEISDDSEYCPYCGKLLESTDGIQANKNIDKNISEALESSNTDEEKEENLEIIKISKVVCYISLGVFLILLDEMAPGYGTKQVISYFAIAAIAIGFLILFIKLGNKAKKEVNKNFYLTSLIIALVVLVSSVVLRIVYEVKLDFVVDNIPKSESVYVKVHLDQEFYSSNFGYVKNPYSRIKIGDEWYGSGDIASIKLNYSYPFTVKTGYENEGGHIDSNITFEPESLQSEYTIVKDVIISPKVVGEVTVVFERKIDFWSVIFY